MAVFKTAVAFLLLTFISQSQAAAPSGKKKASLTYTVTEGNAVKTFSILAYDTKNKPTVTTEVTIDDAPATVVIGPYKNMMTAAAKVKRTPDDIGDHGEPDSDAPGPEPPSPLNCPDSPIPDPTPIPGPPAGQGGSPPPPPLPPSAPYAQGICTFHLTEWYYGDVQGAEPFGLEILMKDAAGTQIGWQVHTAADATHPLDVKSKLEDVFVLTPEEQNSYIQYTLGGQA